MKNREYIKSLCLLGSDRQQLDPSKLTSPLDEMIAQLDESQSAEKILHALALDQFYCYAGTELPSVELSLDIAPITEEAAYAHEKYYPVLKEILDTEKQRTQTSLLSPWINKLRENKTIIHPMHLVKYLNALLRTTKAVKELARPTLGNKGMWLCQQNPKYDKLINKTEDDVWSFGTAKQRQMYLEELLGSDSQAALKLLEDSWESETAREKLKHLKLFLANGDKSHLSFVKKLYEGEFALKQKETVTNRECRNITSKFLLLFPETELHQHTIENLKNYLSQKKKGLLSKVFQAQKDLLNIPASDDGFFNGQEMLQVYGIDPQSTKASEYKTDQLFWFSELCSAIPFETWSSLTGVKSKTVLSDFLNNDQYKIVKGGKSVAVLQQSLMNLTAHYHDDEFVRLLIAQVKDKESFDLLLSRLSPASWENYLSTDLNLVDTQTLANCPHPVGTLWSLDFSQDLLTHTISRIKDSKKLHDYQIGPTLAEYVNVGAIDHLLELNRNQVQQNNLYQYWKNHIFDPVYQSLTIKKKINNL